MKCAENYFDGITDGKQGDDRRTMTVETNTTPEQYKTRDGGGFSRVYIPEINFCDEYRVRRRDKLMMNGGYTVVVTAKVDNRISKTFSRRR